MTPVQIDQGPMATLQRFYAAEEHYVASGGRDFAPFAANIHPEMVVYSAESLPYGGVWRGHDEVRRFLDAFSDAWEELDVRDPVFAETADGAILVTLTMRAKGRASGAWIDAPLCQHVRFRDGLVAEVRTFYWDTAATTRVITGRPDGAS